MPHNDKGRSALADLPKAPFREVTADRSRFDHCFQCLVRYFRRKRLTIESPEDSAQEVLAIAAKKSPKNTQHFLARVAYWHFINCLRKQQRLPANQLVRLDQLPLPTDPIATLANNEHADYRSRAVQHALHSLPRQAAQIVLLRYVHSRNLNEIAALLGVHRNTVRNQLEQASQRLRDMLSGLPG